MECLNSFKEATEEPLKRLPETSDGKDLNKYPETIQILETIEMDVRGNDEEKCGDIPSVT